MTDSVFLKVDNLSKHFTIKKRRFSLRSGQFTLEAVDGISFTIEKGEVFGLAGESGSGKTTTGRMLALLEKPTSGKIIFDGVDLSSLKGHELKRFHRRVQMIFQDPYETLDPRLRIYDAICEPLAVHHIGTSEERTAVVMKTLDRVGLRPPEDFLDRYPHELSGGERQRVSIARAIVLRPEFIVADEPVSMIDMSVRAGILNLMMKLKDELEVTYLFITHDLAVARYITDRLAVMYRGRIQELGSTKEIIKKPLNPYTKALLASVPIPDPEYKRKKMKVPPEFWDTVYEQTGCRFYTRCPIAVEKCKVEEPRLQEVLPGRWVACHNLETAD